MEAKDIVDKEVARQAEFGMEPSWEDFVIAGINAGIKEAVEWIKEKERMTESIGASPNTKHITVYAIDDDEWKQFMESIGE